MAGELDEFAMVADLGKGILDVGGDIIWTLIILAVLGIVGYLVWKMTGFNHTVMVRILGSGGSKFPFLDKVKVVKVSGVTFWKLKKRKDIITTPPQECLTLIGKDWTGKPKFYAECYWSEQTGYVWAQDTVGTDDFTGTMTDNVLKGVFQPFSTQERALHVSAVTKALSRKKKGLLETVTALAIPMMFVMILISILVFWEDIAKPAENQMRVAVEISESNAKISEQNARMLSVLAGKLESGEINIKQTIPPDAGGG